MLKYIHTNNAEKNFTLYKEFLMISMFISSKSCSDIQSTKKGAKQNYIYKNIKSMNKSPLKATIASHERNIISLL